jgi:hypothetical protein
MLNKIHRLEQLGYLHTMDTWRTLREICNRLTL